MSFTLSQRLRDRIFGDGPLTFAQFMTEALYDPEHGFYAEPPIGPDAAYVTSPHVSAAFADLLAVQMDECRRILGVLTVVEAGAGDGTLGSQMLSSSSWDPRDVSYVAVERSPGARAALEAKGLRRADSLPPRTTGVVLANELLDNFPFHRVRRKEGRLLEVFVDADERGSFVEVEAEPSRAALDALGALPAEGEERPASPGWRTWIREVADCLERGWAFVFDYGFAPGEPAQTVRGYAGQRVLDDVVGSPGSRDISTGVDFGVLIEEAKSCGLDVWGPVTQRDALEALGYRKWMEGLRRRQAAAESAGDHRLALRLFAERSRAPMLVDPAHLGGLKLMVLGRGVPAPKAIGR